MVSGAAHVESPIAILPNGAVRLSGATFGSMHASADPLAAVAREAEPTRAELERAERTHEAAERSLQGAQHARDAASERYSLDMSEANLGALRAADERVVSARFSLEARQRQLARAREAHEAEVRTRLHARYAVARERADMDAAMQACGPVIWKLVEIDRAAAPLFAAIRRILGEQRDAVQVTESLAEVLREPVADLRPLHVEDVRALVGVLVHEAREAEGRTKDRLEAIIAPVGPVGSDAAEVVSPVELDALLKRAHELVGERGRAR